MSNMADNPVELRGALTALVEIYGLDNVYEVIRSFNGFCNNCGCVIREDEQHTLGGFGYCYIDHGKS